MADADMFSGMKKVKKTKKQVALDDLEGPAAADEKPAAAPVDVAGSDNTQAAVEPKTEAAAPAPSAGDDLDFSDLKKKKKSKKVQLDLDDLESTPAEAAPAQAEAPAEEAALEDFADLKKKKKKGSKKSAFDLEAFEKELAATESAEKEAAEAGTGPQDADENRENRDDEDDEVPEGEDPFAKDGAAGDESKSKCELAYERKGWILEDRDYRYEELLGRFYAQLYASHPGLSGHAKKRYTIPPPSMMRDGNKRSIFANVADICKKMRRSPEHVIQFLFAELGTTGSVDASSRLVIKGRFQQKQIENVLRRYIVEYVTCKTCKSPDTLLEKDNRLYFVTCNSCQSRRSVASITSGYKALTSKRKAMAAKQG